MKILNYFLAVLLILVFIITPLIAQKIETVDGVRIIHNETNYKIGHDFYKILENKSKYIQISRLLKGQEPTSDLFLRAVDTGSKDGRISLSINKNHYYGSKNDRIYATIKTNVKLNNKQQKFICKKFNEILEENRAKYHSIFLLNFREHSKFYQRKRISFRMSYDLINHIIKCYLDS